MRWSTVFSAHTSSPVTGEMGIPLCGSWPQRFLQPLTYSRILGCISPGEVARPLCVSWYEVLCVLCLPALSS